MKKAILTCGLLIFLAVGAWSLVSCGDQPGIVEGTVTRIESGQAVTEGQVAVFVLKKLKGVGGLDIYEKGDLVQTQNLDENGAFSISLPPGDYVIEAWVPEVAKTSSQIHIKSRRAITVNLQVKTPPD